MTVDTACRHDRLPGIGGSRRCSPPGVFAANGLIGRRIGLHGAFAAK